ncbi:MAG: hypothetical protein LC708_01910, partial [Actinobacteria bacterium]|nr:hypothetical protein [Actinomycetota bacterium]
VEQTPAPVGLPVSETATTPPATPAAAIPVNTAPVGTAPSLTPSDAPVALTDDTALMAEPAAAVSAASSLDTPVDVSPIILAELVTAATAPAPGAAVSQCNGTDNVGGQAVACDVTITNNLDVATGVDSSVVTIRECHGAANAALPCTTSTTPSDQLTTSVTQCDGSGNGGGGTVTCNVSIVNNIVGVSAPTPATINQCNGSGAGGGTLPTVVCDPEGNTTEATITQCNDSGNGGGGTMRVKCTITPSTESTTLPVDVNQCNGSGNGGGGYVTCTVSVTNNLIPPPPVVPVPVPVVPVPVVPVPVVPVPVEPVPVVPVPVVPAPVVPAPVVPAPVVPAPVVP